MIKTGIIGGAGYTAGELTRILLNHPEVEISFIHSRSQAGKPIGTIHHDLIHETDLVFTESIEPVDVLFLCSGHGQSRQWLDENSVSDQTKIIDLSQDFRHREHSVLGDRKFVYGLPELNKAKIAQSNSVANPGCFATAIQLALLPLAQANLLQSEIHAHAITGSTGAGQSPSETSHFSWRNDNVSIYKPFGHQHLAEITDSLHSLQPNFDQSINFIPVRGNFSRGIFATVYMDFEGSEEEAQELFHGFYKDKVFVKVVSSPIHLKQVVNTNYCMLNVEKHNNKLLITSIIDNLLKGASGQAIQNMNLMFGLQENTGLKLKANAF